MRDWSFGSAGGIYPSGLCVLPFRVGKVARSSWSIGVGRLECAGPGWGRRKSTDGGDVSFLSELCGLGAGIVRNMQVTVVALRSSDNTPRLDDFMHHSLPRVEWALSCSHGPIRATLFATKGSQIRKRRPALVVINPHMLPVETRSKASNGPQAPHRYSVSGIVPARTPPRIRDCVVSCRVSMAGARQLVRFVSSEGIWSSSRRARIGTSYASYVSGVTKKTAYTCKL